MLAPHVLAAEIPTVDKSRPYPDRLPSAPRGRMTGWLYSAILIAAIATSGLLRSFHDRTPGLFPGPFGSLLGLAFFALLTMHVIQRRDGRDLFPPLERRGGLRPGLALPLVVVLLGEKWLSVDLLASAFDWIDAQFSDPRMADAIYRLWTALALLATALGFSWVLRQCRHRIARLISLKRLSLFVIYAGSAAAITGLTLWLIDALAGAAQWSRQEYSAGLLTAVCLGQITRAAAEELFYRGFLQTALARVLTEAGLGEGRLPRVLAIVSISFGFALEHYAPSASEQSNLGALAFVFAMSCALGALLEASRNLYAVIVCHGALNLCLAGVLPLPANAAGELVIKPALAGSIFMLAVFATVVVEHQVRGDSAKKHEEDQLRSSSD